MRLPRQMPAHKVSEAVDRAVRGANRKQLDPDEIRLMADRAEDRAAERAGREPPRRYPLDPDDDRIPF